MVCTAYRTVDPFPTGMNPDTRAKTAFRLLRRIRKRGYGLHQLCLSGFILIDIDLTGQFCHHIEMCSIYIESAMSRSLSRDTVDVLLFLRKQPSLLPVRPVAGKYVLSQIRHIDMLSVRRHHSLMDMGTFLPLRVRAPAPVPQDTGRRFQSVILPDPVHGQAAAGIIGYQKVLFIWRKTQVTGICPTGKLSVDAPKRSRLPVNDKCGNSGTINAIPVLQLIDTVQIRALCVCQYVRGILNVTSHCPVGQLPGLFIEIIAGDTLASSFYYLARSHQNRLRIASRKYPHTLSPYQSSTSSDAPTIPKSFFSSANRNSTGRGI